MADIVPEIIKPYPELSAIYQLALAQPLSKYDLLCCGRDAFGLDIDIEPSADFESQPTLDGSKLRDLLKLEIPDWESMMSEIASDELYPKVIP
jgi:hypothetical protein